MPVFMADLTRQVLGGNGRRKPSDVLLFLLVCSLRDCVSCRVILADGIAYVSTFWEIS